MHAKELIVPKPSQHVVPNRGNWSVRSSGSKRASHTFSTRQEAIDAARKRAKKLGTEVYIHGHDGRIHERSSFGSDSRPPKG